MEIRNIWIVQWFQYLWRILKAPAKDLHNSRTDLGMFYFWLAAFSLAAWIYLPMLAAAINVPKGDLYNGFELVIQGIFLFALIKFAFEPLSSVHQQETPEQPRDLGISRIRNSRAQLDSSDYRALYGASQRLWLSGLCAHDLLYANCNGASDLQRKRFSLLINHLSRVKLDVFDLRILLINPLGRDTYRLDDRASGFASDQYRFVEGLVLPANLLEKNIYNALDTWRDRENVAAELTDFVRRRIRLSLSSFMPSSIVSDERGIIQPIFIHEDIQDPKLRTPVLDFTSESQMSSALRQHLESIWKEHSTDLMDFWASRKTGCDAVVHSLCIDNMFMPRDPFVDGLERMRHLIDTTEDYLYIKQVSLYTVLLESDVLKTAFENLLSNPNVKVRLLFIDRDCEAAKLRSYREYHMEENSHCGRPISVREFLDADNASLREQQTLWRNTERSFQRALELQASNDNLQVRTYFAAPDSSIMINETIALYEPLHYGKLLPREFANQKILSGEMPMLEFKKSDRVVDQRNPNRNKYATYDVVKDNFDFVWDHLTREAQV